MRLLGWALWQLFTLLFALFVWASLFGEYGRYNGAIISGIALIVAVTFAIVAGTVIPLRRWRAGDRDKQSEDRAQVRDS
jgi:hypothetical protein